VKTPAVADPPAVVIAIFPDFAPVGTVAVISEPETTVNTGAFIPSNVTFRVPQKSSALDCDPTHWSIRRTETGFYRNHVELRVAL
jgi:hypothetical protein